MKALYCPLFSSKALLSLLFCEGNLHQKTDFANIEKKMGKCRICKIVIETFNSRRVLGQCLMERQAWRRQR